MKEVYEITIDSPIFEGMLKNLDSEIQRVIGELYDGDFEAGEINLKLKLNRVEDYKEYPKEDDSNEIYWYRKPEFLYNISTTLKKQFKQEGAFLPDAEIKLVNDTFVLVPVPDPQMSLFETPEEDFLK